MGATVSETIFDKVISDLKGRDQLGHASYGGPMLPNDGRDSLVEAYEEALDLAMYLRKAIAERDGH
jgi:hypothetical protein